MPDYPIFAHFLGLCVSNENFQRKNKFQLMQSRRQSLFVVAHMKMRDRLSSEVFLQLRDLLTEMDVRF